MELIFATEDFKLNAISYPGFPILLDQNMEFIEETHQFLLHECIKRGRVQSPRSWAVYGQSLYDYFGFLEGNRFDWREFNYHRNHTILAAYRDWSLGELGLNASTVNSRLRVIIRFYIFAVKQGWIDSLPYDMDTIRVRQSRGFLAHTDASGGLKISPDVMLKTQPTEIRVLSRQQVKVLLKSIKNPTLLLITRLALVTGMRKEELATFPVSYVIETAQHEIFKEFVRVKLDPKTMKTKGGKGRGIDIPIRMMEDLRQYVIHRRSALEILSGQMQQSLFLNKQGQPWADGGRGLNNLYRRLGLPFKVTPHILRHTYATHTLYGLRERQSRFDPLLYVRDRLGHSSVSTTEKYLHLLSEVEDDHMTNYQREIDALFT